MAGAFKGFATLLTHVRLLLGVGDGVALQVRRVEEDPRTQLAVQDLAGPQGVGGGGRGQGVQGVQGVHGVQLAAGEDGRGRRCHAGEVQVVLQRDWVRPVTGRRVRPVLRSRGGVRLRRRTQGV